MNSSGLKPAFAGCARKLPRGSLVPPLYLPCRGSLPSIQQAVITTAKCRSKAFGLRARWSPGLAPQLAMRSRRDNLRWPLAIVVVIIFAAPIAYYFSVVGWGLPPVLGPQIASFDQTMVAPQEHDPETSAPAGDVLRAHGHVPDSEIIRERDVGNVAGGHHQRSGSVPGKS